MTALRVYKQHTRRIVSWRRRLVCRGVLYRGTCIYDISTAL